MAQKRINIGNVKIAGFVNYVAEDGKRFVLGTGSYTPKGSSEKVFKESVTVFADPAFDGKIPAKGDYVNVSGDLSISPNKQKPDELNATMNVRFANQVEQAEAPKAKSAAPAGAGGEDI